MVANCKKVFLWLGKLHCKGKFFFVVVGFCSKRIAVSKQLNASEHETKRVSERGAPSCISTIHHFGCSTIHLIDCVHNYIAQRQLRLKYPPFLHAHLQTTGFETSAYHT